MGAKKNIASGVAIWFGKLLLCPWVALCARSGGWVKAQVGLPSLRYEKCRIGRNLLVIWEYRPCKDWRRTQCTLVPNVFWKVPWFWATKGHKGGYDVWDVRQKRC